MYSHISNINIFVTAIQVLDEVLRELEIEYWAKMENGTEPELPWLASRLMSAKCYDSLILQANLLDGQ